MGRKVEDRIACRLPETDPTFSPSHFHNFFLREAKVGGYSSEWRLKGMNPSSITVFTACV